MSIQTRLINRAAVREYTLASLAGKRPHLAPKMTRISAEFFEAVEAAVRVKIDRHVATMPSSGKTIR